MRPAAYLRRFADSSGSIFVRSDHHLSVALRLPWQFEVQAKRKRQVFRAASDLGLQERGKGARVLKQCCS